MNTPEYRAWINMTRRCRSPSAPSFPYYGGRGITVCERWRKSFADFLADMGERPSPKHSLDRFPDNDGNYEPGNVRWATRHEQQANTRWNVHLTVDGRTACLSEWSRMTGLPVSTIRGRLRDGLSHADAVDAKRRRAGIAPSDMIRVAVDGVVRTIAEWADVAGVNGLTIRSRMARGWRGRRAVFGNDGKGATS